MGGLVLGIPNSVLDLVQSNLLERAFYDALYPALMFRGEAAFEEWPENAGTQVIMTRRGRLNPITTSLTAGTDPTPQTLSYEQWVATLQRYGGTIDTHMPTNAVAASDLFLSNIHELGLQAGESINRVARNALYVAYLSGNTVLTAATANADTSIQVASLNGFTDVVIKGTNTRPSPVSVATPLSITIGTASPVTRNVVGATPNDPSDPNGPGILTLSAAVGAVFAARQPVVSAARPQIIRSGGGASVDALTANSTLKLQNLIDGVSLLRKNNVRPHADGSYHAHISNDGNTQLFADPVFQVLNTALPNGDYYQEAFINRISGFQAYLNNVCPELSNSGLTTSTGVNSSLYSQEIGAETVNDGGINVARAILTGRAALYEKGLDEDAYISEAGVTGKEGEFQIVNAGITVSTERIKLILRAPLNRLQDKVAATWSISTSFTPPTDVATGKASRYKRAVVIEHAASL